MNLAILPPKFVTCCINVQVGVLWCISPLFVILENISNIVKNGGGGAMW